MNILKQIAALAALVTLVGVAPVGGRSVAKYRSRVDMDLRARGLQEPESLVKIDSVRELAIGSDTAFEAMKFLYAYMPTPDLTDYSVAFYLENVQAAILARLQMPWGESVPQTLWQHFVLPLRVNNEHLDSCRPVFYSELKERVAGLDMKSAILEVNHWCHEKVTYQPSDARTSSPLATVKSAIGRCGEESTFTVAALRSVGIPARQVYTPRWAHTDDNHAWVEAWADGRWYFLGACEPEPELNIGWFNAPASRGMLMTTNVFGAYEGPDEVLDSNAIGTVINVTANYAPVDTLRVQVLDKAGAPVQGAKVEFGLYNYAEFYPIATKLSDSQGLAQLTAGKGDLLVSAYDGVNFGFAKATVGTGDTLTVVLDKDEQYVGTADFDMVPPPPSASLPQVSEEAVAQNNSRKAYEDSLRRDYEATFADAEQVAALAAALSLDEQQQAELQSIMTRSRGNHATLSAFLTSRPDTSKALALLGTLSDKDLRDVTADVLADAMLTEVDLADAEAVKYLLCPRVENEQLTPSRSYFKSHIPAALQTEWAENPSQLQSWLAVNLRVDDSRNPRHQRMNPSSAYSFLTADPIGRDICFVAMARALGIPAYLDAVDGSLHYRTADKAWHIADFSSASTAAASAPTPATLILSYEPHKYLADPKYYSHFTLSKISGEGRRLLEYGEDDSYQSRFASPLSLDPGRYMLVTGQRLASGEVLSHIDIFSLEAGRTLTRPLLVRSDETAISVIGTLNSEALYFNPLTSTEQSLLSTTGRGYYLLGLISPNHEPSEHLLNELIAARAEVEQYGKPIILLFANMADYERFTPERFASLPSNIVFGVDTGGSIAAEVAAVSGSDARPTVVIADTFNRVVSCTAGYSIGLPAALLRTLSRCE